MEIKQELSETETKAAPWPFNNASADVILRTADKIDFYTHKNILSLACKHFETLFSATDSAKIPVVEVEEDSATLECLLRYCYQVHDNEAPSIQLLGKVLAAAKKYDCPLAVSLISSKLHDALSTDPLQVYVVACMNGVSDLAAHAAMQWREGQFSSLPMPEDEPTPPHMPWQSVDFQDTIVSQCYIPLMDDGFTAGSFFRLLQYARDGQSRHFSAPEPGLANDDSCPATACAEATIDSYPFNLRDADIILRSEDGTDFRVHRSTLETQLADDCTPLETALAGSAAEPAAGPLPVLTLADDTHTLALLLRLCYPARGGPAVCSWALGALGRRTALAAYRAARCYGFAAVADAYDARMRALLPREPLRVYCVAVAAGCDAVAREAARELVFYRLPEMYCEELEALPVGRYFRLVQYHHRCRVAVSAVWEDLMAPGAGTSGVPTKLDGPSLAAGGHSRPGSAPATKHGAASDHSAARVGQTFASPDSPPLRCAYPAWCALGAWPRPTCNNANPPPPLSIWLEAPGVISAQCAFWTAALFEREINVRQMGGRAERVDWKYIAAARDKLEKATEAALSTITLQV